MTREMNLRLAGKTGTTASWLHRWPEWVPYTAGEAGAPTAGWGRTRQKEGIK